MQNSIFSGKGLFRLHDWWTSKAALLMGMVYLFSAWFDISFENFLRLALLSIATISGFASFGYLLNDFFDREKDALAGKKNFLAGKSPPLVVLFFLIALSMLLLPWKYLPFDKFSAALISSQIALFMIYSIPPFRLKERGVAGIIVDALYAHALPVILAAYTFSLAAGKTFEIAPVALLFTWQLASGIRNILLHQADDLLPDKKSGVRNFAASVYPHPFHLAVKYLIIFEVLFSLVLFGILSFTQPLFTICIAAIIFATAIAFLLHEKGIVQLLKGGWRFFPNNVSERWIPPTVLIVLSVNDLRFSVILLLHITVFNFGFYGRFVRSILLPLAHLAKYSVFRIIGIFRIVASALVNQAIYYFFLLFGVDLRKENSSAIDYLRKMKNKGA